ncbi:DUF4407 domain-containing protein [Streptomyces uncialis]|uniref:DUF4407 domain-containing protein n=1 Tax=Streptomyces uncialis TaxID=1048205 RepID=UPI00365047BF
MATDLTTPATDHASDAPDPAPHPAPQPPAPAPAPAPPARGPAARLRGLIGVREDILDHGPEERARYTWYGAIVVNTALFGGASMAIALVTFRPDLPLAVALVVAAVWFWVVLALDSWLVSSTHGVHTKGRLRALLPRLAVSVLLGLFIAEPLLFQVFDPEIRQEISVGNDRKAAKHRGALMSCNPPSGADTTARPECAAHQLKVPGSPAVLRAQLAKNTTRSGELRTQVDRINKNLSTKMATEQRECGRAKWIWWNGVADVSETCERARADSTSYRTSSKIKEYEEELSALTAKGRTLAVKRDSADDTYQVALQRRIERDTARFAGDLDGTGILTRAHALGKVAWSDSFAAFITVLLHLLLLAVDAMPVLAKLMSRPTAYDENLTDRLRAGRRLHGDKLRIRHTLAEIEHQELRHLAEEESADRMRAVETRHQLHAAERARHFRAELDARAARLRTR